MILIPKFISLDTSTISKLAKSYFGDDRKARQNAISVRDGMIRANWFLTLTSDHLWELAQHSNENVVISRFKFLRTFDNLAWIWNFEKTGIGCFLDIDCFEMNAFLEKGANTKHEIVDMVREQLLVVGSGTDLFRDEDYDLWLRLFDECKPGLARSQSVASILRTEPVKGIREKKLREFLNAKYEDLGDLPRQAAKLANVMAGQIKEFGDKRVKGADILAKNFYQQTLEHVGDVQAAARSGASDTAFIEAIAKEFGVPKHLLDLDMTVGELGDWGYFSESLRTYSRKLRCELTLDFVKPQDLIGWSLRLALGDYQNKANRVSGSDFGDRQLACLLPYLDSCEVDKRTMEYLRQIERKQDPIADFLNHRFKCSDPQELLKLLPS
ncbi:MAG: hypothetical protein AAGA30_00160 [Planctomycetota bacterium]